MAIEIKPELELFLAIGLVRNAEYVGLYLNLTAWNEYRKSALGSVDESPRNLIRLSLRPGSKMIAGIEYMIYYISDGIIY